MQIQSGITEALPFSELGYPIFSNAGNSERYMSPDLQDFAIIFIICVISADGEIPGILSHMRLAEKCNVNREA